MPRQNPYRTNTGIHIEWFTVKRSTIYAAIFSVVGLAVAGLWGYFQVYGERAPAAVASTDVDADKTARFMDLSGTVKVRKAGTYEWANARMGMILGREDTIRTVGNSSTRVRLFDGTEYMLKPDSILVIEESYQDPKTNAKHVSVKLDSGQVSLNTPRQDVPGSRSDLLTSTTEASFDENTTADVSFDNSSRVSGFTVFRGGSAVRSGDQEVTLGDAQAIDVTADSCFSNIIELPGVPSLVTPANLSVVRISPTTEFRWHPVDGARKYHFVLDRSPYFQDPILESSVSRVSLLHQGLGAGTYWQVTAIDSDNRRGAPSEFAKFTVTSRVTQNKNPPELTVYKPSVTLGGLVTVKGRTEAGAVVTVDRGMGDDRVQVKGDGSFTYYFEVSSAGRHRVIVKARRRDAGGVAEKTVYAEIGTD